MKKLVFVLLTISLLLLSSHIKAQVPATVVSGTINKSTYEIAENNWVEYGKASLEMLQKGNIDGWMILFDNNARFYWSGGDSLIGKPVITKFWKERQRKVIKQITFSNDFWLPMHVNNSEKMEPGIWLLGWFQFEATFKTGKKVKGRIHHTMHMNDRGLIDLAYQYVDTAPLKDAVRRK